MGRRKKENPILEPQNEEMRICYYCIHWRQCKDGNNFDGAVDFSSGSCEHNGYTKVPPLFTCPGWASGNGEIADTLSLLMSHE